MADPACPSACVLWYAERSETAVLAIVSASAVCCFASSASFETFPDLDADRRRAVVETLVEAVVLAKAERKGSP